MNNKSYGEILYDLHAEKRLQIRGSIKIDWKDCHPWTKGVYDSISKDLIKTALQPILDDATKLCYKIESSGCSKELTECSILAADLRKSIERLTH